MNLENAVINFEFLFHNKITPQFQALGWLNSLLRFKKEVDSAATLKILRGETAETSEPVFSMLPIKPQSSQVY